MSFSITEAFVNQYNANILLQTQQMQSRLAGACTLTSGIIGEATDVERVASTEALSPTGRHADGPLVSSEHTRRWMYPDMKEWGEMIDKDDEKEMLISPASTYIRNGIAALERAKDKIVYDAIRGTAATGHAGATGVVLPVGQKIAAGAAGLTLDKILQTKEKFDTAEIPEEGRKFVASSQQIRNMLNEQKITSADYVGIKALVSGQVDSFLGFQFIRYERQAKVATSRFCVAFHPRSVAFGMWQDNVSTTSIIPLKRNGLYVYMWNKVGAVRLEEEGVVEIECTES